MSVKPLHYEIKDLGKYMKSSKKKYSWRFEISGREHIIELEYSLLSGKRKIIEDGKVLFEGSQVLGAAFQFPFTVEGNNLNIIQQGESFELRINNQVFTHLWQQEKTKSEFQYEEEVNKNTNKGSEFSFGKPDEKWNSGTSFGSIEKKTDEKMKFSVNLNFGKKEAKKSEDGKFPGAPQNSSESNFSQMTNSVPFPKDFTNFSNFPQKNNSEFDFASFDFNKFGQDNTKKNDNQLEKKESKFADTNFSNLGRFSIPAIKKPPGNTNVVNNQTPIQMTQSTALPQKTNIDLLDLIDEPPKKEENKETQPKEKNWDPFAQGKNEPNNTLLNSGTLSTQQQPQLFDLVFTDPTSNKEDKKEGESKNNDKVNLQDAFGDPKTKETEEREKKLSLLDNAFGPSYNAGPHMNQMNMGMYYSQPAFVNQQMGMNMNNAFVPQNVFPMGNSMNMFAMQNQPFMNPPGNSTNMQHGGLSAFHNSGNTPFDQFK